MKQPKKNHIKILQHIWTFLGDQLFEDGVCIHHFRDDVFVRCWGLTQWVMQPPIAFVWRICPCTWMRLHVAFPQWSVLRQGTTPQGYVGQKYAVWPWHLLCQIRGGWAESLQIGGYEFVYTQIISWKYLIRIQSPQKIKMLYLHQLIDILYM